MVLYKFEIYFQISYNMDHLQSYLYLTIVLNKKNSINAYLIKCQF
jgi:hypothetical protein